MKVTGLRVTRESVDIEVTPFEVLHVLRNQILSDPKFGTPEGAEYINSKGVWESWTDTGHGSGLTERYGEATPEQMNVWLALKVLVTYARAM